ncbi:hypothetical protein DHD32_03445 [Arenibacter sp. TNZ]|nr:hypothetical protein [Arenibacter sp. TNZ]
MDIYKTTVVVPYKQGVTGSNPVGPTVTKTRLPRNWEPFLFGQKFEKGKQKNLLLSINIVNREYR